MLVKKTELKQLPMAERKLEGLKKRRKPSIVKYVLEVEKLWEEYAFDPTEENMNRILKKCKFMISKKASFLETQWGNNGLKKSDFESVFYETAWVVCQQYTHYQEFYLYETIHLALKRKSIDVTRYLMTKQGAFNKDVLSLDKLKEDAGDIIQDYSIDVEQEVINNDTVNKILNDSSLTVEEKRLLQVIHSNPDSSNRDIALLAGLKHHTEVTRSLEKIKSKFSHIYL